jgi:hypothetical protein
MPGLGNIKGMLMGGVQRLSGTIVVAAAAKFAERWGGKSSGGGFSAMYGEPWTWQQYAAGLAAALFGGKLLGKFVNPVAFQTGAIDFLLGKALFTEGIARMPELQKYLGEAQENSTYYDPNGQGYMAQDGQYVAMQGLVESNQYDGLGTLVQSNALDGVADYVNGRNTDPYAR